MSQQSGKRAPGGLALLAMLGFATYGVWNIAQAVLWGDGGAVQNAYRPIILWVQIPWGLINLGLAWLIWRTATRSNSE
ncbi:MAG: hypothetical protein RIS43_97 [Actinomycetota bacterium]|jgi:hypothetical protein